MGRIRQDIAFFMIAAIIIAFALVVPAFAERPVGVKHEVIVSKDGDGDYATITEAINYVNEKRSAYDERFVIKVKPGTYDEVINLSYIDLIGAGRDATFINGRIHSMAYGTLRELTIISQDASFPAVTAFGSLIDHVTTRGPWGISAGRGSRIMHSTVFADSVGVLASSTVDGYGVVGLLIEHSEINVSQGTDSHGVSMSNCSQRCSAEVTIRDSKIQSSGSALSIAYGNFATLEAHILDSTLSAPDAIRAFLSSGNPDSTINLYIVNAQLDGNYAIPNASIYKIINSYDGFYNPIPNQ